MCIVQREQEKRSRLRRVIEKRKRVLLQRRLEAMQLLRLLFRRICTVRSFRVYSTLNSNTFSRGSDEN